MKKKVLIAIILLIVLAAIFGNPQKTTSENNSENKTTEEVQREYTELAKFSGSGAKRTDTFKVDGERFKVAYKVEDTSNFGACFFSGFAVTPGKETYQGQNIANTTVETTLEDESVVYKSGEFYLDINSANCAWDIIVYNYK